jgi:methylase of polypeptide subunit release factors
MVLLALKGNELRENWWWLDDKYWLADMESVMESHLEFIEKQKKEVVSIFYGHPIKSTDGVYHPIDGSSTHFIGDALFGLLKPEASLLEVGCGSGALSCVAAKLGAARVVASDISDIAISCTQDNVKHLDVGHKVEVVKSHLLDKIPNEQFDFIIFNAPLLHCEPMPLDKKEYNEIAIDYQGEAVIEFIDKVAPFLKKGGKLLVTISNIGCRKVITKLTNLLGEIGQVEASSAMYRKSGDQWRFVLSVEKAS